jgi:hypothetical protein
MGIVCVGPPWEPSLLSRAGLSSRSEPFELKTHCVDALIRFQPPGRDELQVLRDLKLPDTGSFDLERGARRGVVDLVLQIRVRTVDMDDRSLGRRARREREENDPARSPG